MGGSPPKKRLCSLPSFLMVKGKLLAAGGFVEARVPTGGVDRTANAVLVEPDPWDRPLSTCQQQTALTSGTCPQRAHSCRNPSGSGAESSLKLKREPCKTRPSCHSLGEKKARSKSRERAASAFLFELLSRTRFSQNNLIVYFFVDRSIFVDEH